MARLKSAYEMRARLKQEKQAADEGRTRVAEAFEATRNALSAVKAFKAVTAPLCLQRPRCGHRKRAPTSGATRPAAKLRTTATFSAA
jgi:hypothetical protein